MAMQNSSKKTMSQRWHDYQPTKSVLVWSCIGAVVAAIIVGFSWGGWVTGGTSQTMAKAAGDAARGELASAISTAAAAPSRSHPKQAGTASSSRWDREGPRTDVGPALVKRT